MRPARNPLSTGDGLSALGSGIAWAGFWIMLGVVWAAKTLAG